MSPISTAVLNTRHLNKGIIIIKQGHRRPKGELQKGGLQKLELVHNCPKPKAAYFMGCLHDIEATFSFKYETKTKLNWVYINHSYDGAPVSFWNE